MRRLPVLCGSLAVALLATPVTANMGTGFPVRAVIPVICVADFEAAVGATGDPIRLGELRERCNAAAGYRVYVDHPPALIGVALILDGHAVPLDPGGRTLLVDADQAAIRSRPVYVQVSSGGPAVQPSDFVFEQADPKS
jgi:hypothetical protein